MGILDMFFMKFAYLVGVSDFSGFSIWGGVMGTISESRDIGKTVRREVNLLAYSLEVAKNFNCMPNWN